MRYLGAWHDRNEGPSLTAPCARVFIYNIYKFFIPYSIQLYRMLSLQTASNLCKELCEKCNIMNNKNIVDCIEMNAFSYNCKDYCIVLFSKTIDENTESNLEDWRIKNNLKYKKMIKLDLEIYY
jgi:hypothetical protein